MHSYFIASCLILPSALAAGLYAKGSPVLNLDFKSYDSLIAKSNHSSIVEFYAPWCGHCQSLKPAYEKAAKSLAGLAKVGAVNCDDEENKPFCGSMEVKGFPTLKIIRPNSKKAGGRPIVEDYQGQRSAKAIVDAVIEKIPNHVTRLKDKDLDSWMKSEGPKAILFSDKGTVSALLKSLAIDYLGAVSFAQIRDKEVAAVKQYGVDKFPTLVLVPAPGEAPKLYTGEMSKEKMLDFLKTVAQPNPDPPAKKPKSDTKTNKSKASKDSSSLSKASASQASSQAANARPSQESETIIDDIPIPSPDPKVIEEKKPIKVPDLAPAIPSLTDGLSLQQKCLNSKAGTCILLLLPKPDPQNPYPPDAISSLSEIHAKHASSGRKIFPFYQLPEQNSQAQALRKLLKLDNGVEVIAINGKKSWWRRYEGLEYQQASIETWIDEIRMGYGTKQKVPKTISMDAADLPPEAVKSDVKDGPSIMEKLKSQLPDGVELAMHEIDDAEYEHMMKASEQASEKSADQNHNEL